MAPVRLKQAGHPIFFAITPVRMIHTPTEAPPVARRLETMRALPAISCGKRDAGDAVQNGLSAFRGIP